VKLAETSGEKVNDVLPIVPCVSVVNTTLCAPSIVASGFKTIACVVAVSETTFAAAPSSPFAPSAPLNSDHS
jgi:hypothetical protein